MAKEVGIQQVRTKKGILSIIDVILALGKRGIAFRGNWDKITKTEDGDFSFFVKWKSQFDRDLEDHIQHAARNAKYTSPIVQNAIISLCEEAIREKILSNISSYGASWPMKLKTFQVWSRLESVHGL